MAKTPRDATLARGGRCGGVGEEISGAGPSRLGFERHVFSSGEIGVAPVTPDAGMRSTPGLVWSVVLGFWSGAIAGVAGWGGLAPPTSALHDQPVMAGVCLSGACLAACFAACLALLGAQGTRMSWIALTIGGAALGLACAKSAIRPLTAVQHVRGIDEGLWVVTVEGASSPGPRCRIDLLGGDARLELDPDAGASCRAARGESWAIRGSSTRVRAVPDWARGQLGGGGPIALRTDWARALGPPPSGARWRRGLAAGYWSAVADVRGAAWRWSRGDDARGLVVASTIGLRTGLSPSARATLRAVGLGHLIAVSGLHVGWVTLVVFAVSLRLFSFRSLRPGSLRIFGGGRGAVFVASALSAMAIVAFVGLTGAAPSAVRAGLMAVAVLVGWSAGRKNHSRLLPALVLMLMVIMRPQWLANPGFQLSAAATWAIVTATPMVSDREPSADAGAGRHGPPSALYLSWRIAWATAGVSIWWFGRASWAALVANLFALPVFGLVLMPFAALGGAAVLITGAPGPWIAPAVWAARLLLDGAAALEGLVALVGPLRPGTRGAMSTASGAALMLGIGWHAVAIATWWRRRRARWTDVDASGEGVVGAWFRRWRPPAWGVAALLWLAWVHPRPPALSVPRGATLAVHEGRGAGVLYHGAQICLEAGPGAPTRWSRRIAATDLAGIDRLVLPAFGGRSAAYRSLVTTLTPDVVERDDDRGARDRCVPAAVRERAIAAAGACRHRFPEADGVAIVDERGVARCWSGAGALGGWKPLRARARGAWGARGAVLP